MGSRSCTTTIQTGYTQCHRIQVIDTPGFYSSEDIETHITAQKCALEGTALSGIYAVVKFGRADEMAETLGKIMDFVGDDDIRIVITHGDIARQQAQYSEDMTKERLSELLDIPISHIAIVGRNTSSESLESFIVETLHEPRFFEVCKDQLAYMAALTVGARKCNKFINDTMDKLEAARKECLDLIATIDNKCYEADVIVALIQHAAKMAVSDAKIQIFRAAQDMTPEQQKLAYSKTELALPPQLEKFVAVTNGCFSWDLSDLWDDRNEYRQCNSCGSVYCLRKRSNTCDELSTEPCKYKNRGISTTSNTSEWSLPMLAATFEECATIPDGWQIGYRIDEVAVSRQTVLQTLERHREKKRTNEQQRPPPWLVNRCQQPRGHAISWASLLPIHPDVLAQLTAPTQPPPHRIKQPKEPSRSGQKRTFWSILCSFHWCSAMVLTMGITLVLTTSATVFIQSVTNESMDFGIGKNKAT